MAHTYSEELLTSSPALVISFVAREEIHPLSITCPVLQSTVELSGNAMESQSQLILVACVVSTVMVWNNYPLCVAVQLLLYTKYPDKLTMQNNKQLFFPD